MDTVFVIGAGGFVGRHVVRHLASHGLRVVAATRAGSNPPPVDGVEWVAAELDSENASTWPARYDAVVYLAQSGRWREFPLGADDVVRVNVAAVQRAADHARSAGGKRFIHMSSGTVYAQTKEPAREDEPIPISAPRSFYAASKLAAEILLGSYSPYFGMIQLRLFMPYGTGQNERMLLPLIVSKVRDGVTVDLHGSEGLTCNPIAVRDVAETVRRCLTLDGSHTLNVAGPEQLTLRQIAGLIGTAVGREPVFTNKPGTAPVIVGDTSRLQAALGWQPPIRFAEGVKEWINSPLPPLRGERG